MAAFPVCTQAAGGLLQACPNSGSRGIMKQAYTAWEGPGSHSLLLPFAQVLIRKHYKSWHRNSKHGPWNLMFNTLHKSDAHSICKCLSELCILHFPQVLLMLGHQGTSVPVRIQDCLLWTDSIVEMTFNHKMFSKNKNQDNIQR